MAKIRNLKKFKKYNMRVIDNTVLLICNESESLKKEQEFEDQKLISDIFHIGKNINREINTYLKREGEKERINSENISFDAMDMNTKNKKVIELLQTQCSRDFKELTITNNIMEESDYPFVDIDKYNVFSNVFNNCYILLKKKGIDLESLNTPIEIEKYIRYEKYGIRDVDFGYKEASTKLYLNYINLVDLLNKNKDNIDYSSLLNKVNYIPINIKHFFGELIENNPENTHSKNIFNQIKNFCEMYGLPYWKTEIYDKREIEVPMNNFILICLAVYVFIELWNRILKSDELDEWDDFINTFGVLGINIMVYEKKSDMIKMIISSIEDLDFYISNQCNDLLGHKINNYRKKVLDKSSNTLRNETVYDSIILAAWDIFYLHYFGNDRKFKPVTCKICIECHKEIINKIHVLKDGKKSTICDKCYTKRKKLQTKERVNKYRNKKDSN